MKMMIVAGLQHLATNKSIAIRTLNAKRFLVTFLTIRNTILAHIFAIQHSTAIFASKTPYVPLSIQCDQCLALFQLITTTGTFVWIVYASILFPLYRFGLVVLLGGGSCWTTSNFFDWRCRLLYLWCRRWLNFVWNGYTFFTQNFFAGVCYL